MIVEQHTVYLKPSFAESRFTQEIFVARKKNIFSKPDENIQVLQREPDSPYYPHSSQLVYLLIHQLSGTPYNPWSLQYHHLLKVIKGTVQPFE